MAGCTGTTRKGRPCLANTLKGRDVCLAHADATTRESAGFIAANGKAGRIPNPRAIDVLRERLERDIDKWLKPLEDALTAERTYVTETEVISKPDHAIRMAAAREGLDRAYGKPKQATEISGPAGGPIEIAPVEVPDTAQYRRKVAEIAAQSMGVVAATNGNGNGHH
jgi:hypothetical protein